MIALLDVGRQLLADVLRFAIVALRPTHFFVSHALALMYAREWAKANPPSALLVVGPDGKIVVSETYAVTAVQVG